jgi:cytochrome c-type biogenesis protein CcmF
VGPPFFNKVNIPIGLFLLLLTGVGPLIAWRRSSTDALRRAFLMPTAGMLIFMGTLFALGIRHGYALMSFGLCFFVMSTILGEFWKGARSIQGKDNLNLMQAVVELTHRNTRRYGGYIVHVAIVIMFIGFTGAAFNLDTVTETAVGARYNLGHYDLRVKAIKDGENDNYAWNHAIVDVYRDGSYLGELKPERRLYKARRGAQVSNVAIRRRLNEDLYMNFAGLSQDGQKAILQTYVFPLVSWIWVGYWCLFFGTLICLIPPKVKLQYARTEVVGVARQTQPVES